MSERPYSVKEFAEWYGLSDHHVRNMIHDGRLKAFRAGGKLLRITKEAARQWENQQIIGSASSMEDGSRSGGSKASATDGGFKARMRLLRERNSANLPENVTDLSSRRSS